MRLILFLLTLILSSAQAAGLLGTGGSLKQTAFCRSYICGAPTVQKAGDFTKRTYPVGGGSRQWSVVETSRAGRVVSLRWTTSYQDTFTDLPLRTMLGRLAQTGTGAALSASEVGKLDTMALEGRTVNRPLGSGRLLTLTEWSGHARNFHFIVTSLSPSALAAAEPPRIRMTAQEIARVTARLREAAIPLMITGGTKCPGGVHITAMNTTIRQTYEEQENDIFQTVDEIMTRLGFTFDGSFHNQFTGTTYEATPLSGGAGVCVVIKNFSRPAPVY